MANSQPKTKHWVDSVTHAIAQWKIEQNIELLHVDDMKTPSGRVHTGALRGVMIHDVVAQVLREEFPEIESTYVFNDMDPMDSLPGYLDESIYAQYMGVPLYKIPTPSLEKSGVDFSNSSESDKKRYSEIKNFAEFYAQDFIDAFRVLGCSQEIVWSHVLYESGKMDKVIEHVLNHVEDFKKIYKEVADYQLPDKWYPFQVICPECGKVGSTLTTGWDGKEVSFECLPDKVEWAKGCGYTGKISPFGGTGKFLWKVDWPAHWQVLGVNIEGAGKDHTTAGGSRDMANAIVEKIFKTTAPFDIPYEWILIRGTKMSSSKGIGTSAREFVELFPPEIGRFLFINRHYNQVIDFDPQSMAIPDLFDECDQAAKIFWKQDEGDERAARSFELSYTADIPAPHYLPRFRDLAIWMQYPEINVVEKFAELKGEILTKTEHEELSKRMRYAHVWLKRYAPEEFQFTPKTKLPEKSKELSEEQKMFLKSAVELVDSKDWVTNELELQTALFELAKQTVGPKKAFSAIYIAFLGKTHGPRAAWFLLSIDKNLTKKRVTELSSGSLWGK